jgi:RNA polymerase sigma-70 factor (ECF subfamily)
MEEGSTIYSSTAIPLADDSLPGRIAAGDEEAFAHFYRAMVPQLRPFIYSITASDALVEEVIQESFLRFWLNRDKLPGILDPKAWLFKITANICYTLFQRAVTEKKALNVVEERLDVRNPEATERVQLSFLKIALQEGVSRLSPQRKKVYQLSREQGLSIAEIADHLDLSIQTVRNTLSASLESLREHLARQGYSISLITFVLILF